MVYEFWCFLDKNVMYNRSIVLNCNGGQKFRGLTKIHEISKNVLPQKI